MTPALQEAWLDHLGAVYAEPPGFTAAVWKTIGQAERDGELVTLWRRLRIVHLQRKTAPGCTPVAVWNPRSRALKPAYHGQAPHTRKDPMKQLLTALNAVMKQAGYVQKGSQNTHHKYWYANEADLLAVVRPAMIEHGILLIGPRVVDDERVDANGNCYLTMEWDLAHVSGEVWPNPLRVTGCGNDQSGGRGTVGDKGVYKAYTGAVKYLLFKFMLIATGDDPEDAVAQDYAPGQGGQPAANEAPGTQDDPPRADGLVTDEEMGQLWQALRDAFGDDAENVWRDHIKSAYNKKSTKDLTSAEAQAATEHYRKVAAKKKAA